jgi:tetratricopeptide (TPR) repeat protein
MSNFFKVVDAVLIPVVLLATWLILFLTADVRGLAAVVTLIAFGAVLVLWLTYRQLRTHAAASRMAAQGEPRELIALAERELGRRLTPRSKVPFHLYRSIGHSLLGEAEAARQALAPVEPIDLGRSWGLLVAAQQVALDADAGDAAAARKRLDETVVPLLRKLPGAGVEVIGVEAEARVLFAEGKLDEARAKFEKLARDIRLGPATRAICRHFVGRCLEANDPEAARAAFAEAAKLAPKTWVATSAR